MAEELKKPLKEEATDAESDRLPLGQELAQMSAMAVQLSSTRIVRILLTVIDAAFLGHLGTKQLAGVALSAMWQGVPATFVQFCLQAITTLAAQARGAGNKKLVGGWLQTALFIAILGCVPVMILFWNIHYLVGITMKDDDTVNFARIFSQTMMWSLLPQFIYVAVTAYFSTIGVVMPATVCTVITVLMNIIFNYVFIYGYTIGGMTIGAWGFIGSPIATVTSSWLQLILFVTYCFGIKKHHQEYWGGWDKENISWGQFSSFMKLGLPTGLSSVVDWASGAVAGSFSGLLGSDVAAGQNVLNGLFALTYSTVSGFSTATQIRLARYLGEGKPDDAKRILRIGSSTLIGGGIIICIFVTCFHSKIWQLWTEDQVVVDKCDSALYAFMAGVMMAYIRFTLTIVMSSLGPREAFINLVANNIASWVIYIPLAYMMPIVWNWGISGFWWSDFYGEAFKVLCLAVGVAMVDWKKASDEARRKAGKSSMTDRDDADAKQREQVNFASAGAISSPAGNINASNALLQSPAVTIQNAQSSLEYVRSPQNDVTIDL